MKIRPILPTDREALKAITVEAFSGVSIDQNIERRLGHVGSHDWAWRKARQIDDDIDAPQAAVLVCEDASGEILGYITTRIDPESGVGFIPNMSVRAGSRGQGIGRQLIEAALQLFRESGLELARIETLDQNPVGQHLYPDCGFVEVARQIHYARRL